MSARTDRELLELAAKAAGIALWPHGEAWRGQPFGEGLLLKNGGWVWNPLVHDGDALRLAVKLRIDLSLWVNTESVSASVLGFRFDKFRQIGKFSELRGDDEIAATRRAIVRAAAAIGEAM